MKYALFEFANEKACEVGETRWILRENLDTFKNVGWDCNKDVMVAWPKEFAKIHKRIIKGSLDPSALETKTCVAKVLKFSGKSATHCCVSHCIIIFCDMEIYMGQYRGQK